MKCQAFQKSSASVGRQGF